MTKVRLGCLISVIAITVISSARAQSPEVQGKIRQTQQKIDAQIERIRQARELADSEMALAKIRIGEQLRKSQEDLARQTENLERLREKLAEQKSETSASVSDIRNNWSEMIDKAFSDVESGIQDANSLINKMQRIGEEIQEDTEGKNSASCNGSSSAGPTTTTDVTVQTSPQPEDSGKPQIRPVGG
ncbi:MAG: hypothetical protein HY912_01390 [Desulfomonile tiedjei]|uniref:Secreted protein n=1 Tax=Desulfomonile tiedjei TaxID=2358 RepID=A0A9D6UXA0_9BACT|nr:hypothetical protein [Desulfomonile tiedjei]